MFKCSNCYKRFHTHYKIKNINCCVWCNIQKIINKL